MTTRMLGQTEKARARGDMQSLFNIPRLPNPLGWSYCKQTKKFKFKFSDGEMPSDAGEMQVYQRVYATVQPQAGKEGDQLVLKGDIQVPVERIDGHFYVSVHALVFHTNESHTVTSYRMRFTVNGASTDSISMI